MLSTKHILFIFFRMGSITTEDEPQLTSLPTGSDMNKFKILESTDQIKELQTIIRDKETNRYKSDGPALI